MKGEQANILARLRRIEGQIRGLQRMVENKAPCPEILTQVSAVMAAVKKAGMVIVQTHMDECMTSMQNKAGRDQDAGMEDFMRALSRYIDLA